MEVAPSILSSDFSKLEEEIRKIEEARADMVHIDVMDGVFVDNITIGPCVIKAIRKITKMPFDVHLMIIDPHKYIDEFVDSGADTISFHVEAETRVSETIQKIKSRGRKAGLSVKPSTPVHEIEPYLEHLDVVLIMTVEPGFAGQVFIPEMMEKVSLLRTIIEKRELKTKIEIDGGINEKTVRVAGKAGVEICVAGSAIFSKKDYRKAILTLKQG